MCAAIFVDEMHKDATERPDFVCMHSPTCACSTVYLQVMLGASGQADGRTDEPIDGWAGGRAGERGVMLMQDTAGRSCQAAAAACF